jgi:hypothetical protein
MTENTVKAAIKNPFLFYDSQKERKNEGVTEVAIAIGKDGKKVYEKVVHKTPEIEVFKRYKNLSEISTHIARELISDNAYNNADVSNLSYQEIRDKGLTFFMSSDAGFARTGLLSLCPALLTGIKLYATMPESRIKTELLSDLKSGIEAVFKFIYRDADWRNNSDLKPVFDASPYESDAFYPGDDDEGLNGRSYIDSISWATPLFLRIMNFVDKDKKFVFEEYRGIAKKLAKWCLNYVNNAVLTVEAEENDEIYQRPVGWSFSKIVTSPKTAKAQRSLYFTYAAASMYLSFYDEYTVIIDNLMTLNRKSDKGKISLRPKYHTNNFKQAEEAIAAYERTMDEEEAEQDQDLNDLKEALSRLKRSDKSKLEDYYFFNDEKSAEYNGKIYTVAEINNKTLGAISQFKWNLEKISNDLWEEAKTDDILENNFVYDDFNFNIATAEAIQSGGQTNALFAGLLHISICLYSTYNLVISFTEDDGTGKFGQKAHEDMQNTMLLHVQRAQRFFNKLEEKGKAFGVDSLTLRFSEDYSNEADREGNLTDRELAEKLRKQSIHITSLTPMLLKTNNLISQYVIRYPQKQMGESLIRIGEKRFYDRKKTGKDENEKYRWYWDSDGYHAMSNYYYVMAIFNFYDYYRAYEQEYIARYADLRKTLISDLDFTESVRKHYQEIEDGKEQLAKEYELKLKAKDDEIAGALTKVKKSEIGDKLVSDINQVVEDSAYFDDPRFFRRIIDGIRKQLAEELVARYARNPQEDKAVLEKLTKPSAPKNDALFSLLQALAADIILPSAIEARKSESTELVTDLGKEGLEGIMPADFALKGGRQLINDGLIDKLFAFMCSQLIWKDQKNK